MVAEFIRLADTIYFFETVFIGDTSNLLNDSFMVVTDKPKQSLQFNQVVSLQKGPSISILPASQSRSKLHRYVLGETIVFILGFLLPV